MINVGITEKHLFEVHYMKTVLKFEITLFCGNYFFDVGIEGKGLGNSSIYSSYILFAVPL